MNKSVLIALLISVFLFNCSKEQDPYLITRNSIGLMTDSTKVKDLKNVFSNDSISDYKGDSKFNISTNTVDVYEKKGELLLSLTPKTINDSTSTITNVRILDSRFKTEKGISTLSTFKEIQDAYKISKIDNLINTIVVSVNEINAQFAIDKKELPANLRYDMGMKFEASQIPDMAKTKYFFINWD